MSVLSERLSDADLDAIARILHAVRQRRAERERALTESPANKGDSRTAGAA